MPLDSNGIWQYEESEAASPFSALLNKLASSVSTAFGLLSPVVPIDWTSSGVVAGSGVTLTNVQYKMDRLGRVSWRGELFRASGQPAQNDVLFTFPSDVQPSSRLVRGIEGFAGAARVFVGSFGGAGSQTEVRFREFTAGAIGTNATVGLSVAGLAWSHI